MLPAADHKKDHHRRLLRHCNKAHRHKHLMVVVVHWEEVLLVGVVHLVVVHREEVHLVVVVVHRKVQEVHKEAVQGQGEVAQLHKMAVVGKEAAEAYRETCDNSRRGYRSPMCYITI